MYAVQRRWTSMGIRWYVVDAAGMTVDVFLSRAEAQEQADYWEQCGE